MNKPLRILHLEDEPDFSALVAALMEREGLEAQLLLVSDFKSFTEALEQGGYDAIIADYMLPTCNGLQALEAARQQCPDVPFVVLSGAIGEHAAIDFLHCGATDYVLKSGLERLVPSIRRAVQEAEERRQRKLAEAEAREGERQYRLIFDGNPVPMWVSDLKSGAFLEVNEAAIRHYGYSRDEFLGMTTRDVCSPEEASTLADYLGQLATQGAGAGPGHAGKWQHRKRDGSLINVDITWSMLQFKGHEALLTMANDVTELQRASVAQNKSEASLAAAQRIARLGSWEMDLLDAEDLNRNPLYWSDETYRIFGLEPRQAPVTNEFFFNSVHPDDRQHIREAMSQAFRDRVPYDVEHRILLPDGGERIVRARAEFALDESGKPVQLRGIVIDTTDRKRLEEQLRQSQKMEAIGRLAGGMAHDFNNILTVTHGHALLLLQEKNLSKSGKDSAHQIAQAAERAAGVTRPLLAFSRRQVMQPRPLDLNEVLSNMAMMLGRILGEDIVLQLKYCPQPAVVLADASMIEHVMLNLAGNARDAMPKGGELALEVSQADIGPTHVASHPEARAGKFVCLSVIDNGTGIAPEHLRRIFEPFFTTKEVGKRSGLGLATVYGIVKQHQGWIEAESEPGKGAAFRVYLPVSTSKEGAPARKPAKQTVRGGTETILVVEDEAPVRDLVCKVLSGYGYKIVQAASGTKALDVWRRSKNKIDLLLTDLVLPDQLNGRELAEKLKKNRPKLKVIFSSGYSPDVVGKDFVLQRGQHFLQKPYDLQKLALTVRACLDAR
jgi:two-component system cell cycle sensor histidine kinase/response regulator CckA